MHITRDFASGLPILRRLRYLEIINALIDDDAADILIERLGSNMGHVTSSQMLETTFEKLSASSHFKVTPHTQPRPLPTAPATTPQPVKSP